MSGTLRQQLVVLDHQLAALKAEAADAEDTGDSGVFRGVGQARNGRFTEGPRIEFPRGLNWRVMSAASA